MAVNIESHTASLKGAQDPAQTLTHEYGNETASQKTIYALIRELVITPEDAEETCEKIRTKVGKTPLKELKNEATKEQQKEKETVLHHAIKYFNFENKEERKVFTLLLKTYPSLMDEDRAETQYEGQTPLHLAVCKSNEWLLNIMMKHFKVKSAGKYRESESQKLSDQKLSDILETKATGPIFKHTVMMGELPLSIAALAGNKKAFTSLLEAGAKLDEVNMQKDNVCHSLIRYAFLYKEKMEDILDMLGTICEAPKIGKVKSKKEYLDEVKRIKKVKETRDELWMMTNKQGLNPLQLAAALGLHDIFHFIIGQKIYCHENLRDGVFDVKMYDVTDLDAIWTLSSSDEKETKDSEDRPYYNKSILMILLDLEPNEAIEFVTCEPVKRCIDLKWQAYGKFFYGWMFFHVLFMSLLIWYSVERSKQLPIASNSTYDLGGRADYRNRILRETFVTVYGFITFAVGLLYIMQDLVRVSIGRMPWTYKSLFNPYSNWWFRSICNCFGLCLILDVFLAIWSDNYRYDNYVLVVANVVGWFLVILFSRVVKQFSFFAILIQKVLLGDMLRFAIILFIETIAFATAMYMAVQGSQHEDEKGFLTIWHVLFTMFNLMIGVGDLEFVYQTRNPGLCIAIFVFFVILTTILMVNALIAMMSSTCEALGEDIKDTKRYKLMFKLQKLAMILFAESILPKRWVRTVGVVQPAKWYDSSSENFKEKDRYILKVVSIECENINDEPLDDRMVNSFKNFINKLISKNKRNENKRPKSPIDRKGKKQRNNGGKKEGINEEDQAVQTLEDRTKKEIQGPGLDEIDFFRPLDFTRPGEIDVYHIASYNKCACTMCNCNKCNSTRVITHGIMAPDVNGNNNINI